MKPLYLVFILPLILTLDSCIVVGQVDHVSIVGTSPDNTMPDKDGLCYYIPPVMKQMPDVPSAHLANQPPAELQKQLALSLQAHRRYIIQYMIDVNNDYAKYRERCHF